MAKEKSFWSKYGWIILLVFGFLVILYYAVQSLKQQQELNTEEEKEKQLKLLENRYSKLRVLVEKKKNHQRWLDWGFRLSYTLSKILIIGFGVACAYSANLYYEKPQLEEYLTWLAFLALLFTALAFLIFGLPLSVASALKQVKPKLKSLIYGQYLGIDNAINADEKEIRRVEIEIDKIKKENDEP